MADFLTPDRIDDFVQATLSEFKKHTLTDISLVHQEYIASKILTDKNVSMRGGKNISHRLMTKLTGNARNFSMFGRDVTKVEDVLEDAEIPWRLQTTNFSYDVLEDEFSV